MPPAEPASLASRACRQCGLDLAPSLLACPSCRALVHADTLGALASRATAAVHAGDHGDALAAWREALTLLPTDSRQYARVEATVRELSLQVDATRDTGTGNATGAARTSQTRPRSGVRSMIAAGVSAVAVVAGKAKFLLLGLTKLSTVASMLAMAGVYWSLYGWSFAVGFVAMLYVHEMGHVVALRRFGIAATAPMFIPGIGAVVRMRGYPIDAREDARVGLAGPLWGACGAAFVLAVGALAHWPAWRAVGFSAAWLNLFNLLPVWQLDGGRGVRAVSRAGRLVLAIVCAGAAMVLHREVFVLGAAVMAWRAIGKDAPATSDRRALVEFVTLVVALAAMVALGSP